MLHRHSIRLSFRSLVQSNVEQRFFLPAGLVRATTCLPLVRSRLGVQLFSLVSIFILLWHRTSLFAANCTVQDDNKLRITTPPNLLRKTVSRIVGLHAGLAVRPTVTDTPILLETKPL